MKSFYLREELVPVEDLSGNGAILDKEMLAFKWAMVEPGKYVIVSTKLFKKSIGDTVTIMTEKEFLRFFRKLNRRAR